MIRKFLNEQGFSVVQAMVFAGVMAAGALVMTRTITDLKLTQKGAEVRDDLETFHASVVSALQDSNHCTATHLYNVTPPPAKQIRLSGGEVLAQENQVYMNNAIKVNTIEFNAAPSPTGSYTITYAKLKSTDRLKQGYGGKDIRKVIPVNFVFNGATFSRCYLDENVYNSQTAQEFCTSLGNFMVWDPMAKKCSLRSHNCSTQPGTVFAGIDSNGQEICQKITDAIITKDLFGIGTVNCPGRTNLGLTVVGGQIVIACNPGGCLPTSPTTCAELLPNDCPALPNATNNCGTDCGTGTKASGCACVETSPNTCAELRPNDCPDLPNAVNNCGADCGTGTKASGCACTPTETCASIQARTCTSQSAGSDDCSNPCGMGTLECCVDQTCLSGKDKFHWRDVGQMSNYCSLPGANCGVTAQGRSTCWHANSSPYVMCGYGYLAAPSAATPTQYACDFFGLTYYTNIQPCPGTTCTPSCPAANTICQGETDTRPNGCGSATCNVAGTKTDGPCACVPAIPCSTIAAGYCSTNPEEFDSCGNACGPGTQTPSCPPPDAVCSGCLYTGTDGCAGTCNVMGTSSTPDPACFRPADCTAPPLNTYCCNGARVLSCGSCSNFMGASSCGGPPYDYIDCY